MSHAKACAVPLVERFDGFERYLLKNLPDLQLARLLDLLHWLIVWLALHVKHITNYVRLLCGTGLP